MKSILERSNKPNKRSQALKSILQKQGIEHIAEDPIEGVIEATGSTNTPKVVTFGAGSISQSNGQTNIAQSIELFNQLIAKELARAASGLGIDEAELQAWVDLQIEVPAKVILTLLRMMQNLHLDPLSEEIGCTQYEDGQWQVLITIEGCAKLLNQHPQFNGLHFTQADTLIDGLPEWLECSIYRKDREVPTTVREYLTEVKGENETWKKMPRRMLRHRALQQCVRLAIA
ncbi:recombinase RecT [Polynucleobacter sp. AP-Ainpum-60-G11]|uniref:recombinase RecT n=1 Tax=Polynucleobacter sp. AP-Ainpum-60-G11 TaxID=2576926 RepID=UPI001BFCE088|nr:recombinase RecT [Polynucleobacter sp. AP-Ainpum-60-G11]QWE27136.1 recombinase RecT [Polynucleobacter sp. AP-Ainpum-60-G11]